jgi:predicted dehydrogenase
MTLRVGFVGTGWIAGRHMQALKEIPEARVVAFTDVDEDRAAEKAAQYAGAGAFTDVRKMLDDADLDAVYVCVPPHAHGDTEKALIERGVPFLVEKPLANDREPAAEIAALMEHTALIVSVGYHMRYVDTVERVRDHLAAQEPVLARGHFMCRMPPAPWWRRKEQSGGQVVEQTTHIFDLCRLLFGEVESVHCVARRGLITDVEGYSVEDASICTLKFRSGLLCETASSCAVTPSRIGLDIICRDGAASLSGGQLDLTLKSGPETHQYAATGDPYLRENQAFVQAVVEGDRSPIRSSYADAYRTHLVTMAANESMASGETVTLDGGH